MEVGMQLGKKLIAVCLLCGMIMRRFYPNPLLRPAEGREPVLFFSNHDHPRIDAPGGAEISSKQMTKEIKLTDVVK